METLLKKKNIVHCTATRTSCNGAPVSGCIGRHQISQATRLFQSRSFKNVQGHEIDASTEQHPLTAVSSACLTRIRRAALCTVNKCIKRWHVPSRRARNSRSCPPLCRVPSWTWLPDRGTVPSFSSFEIPLVHAHLSEDLPVVKSSILQGASFSFNVFDPPHKEPDPTVHDVHLLARQVLFELLSGAPRAARPPSSSKPMRAEPVLTMCGAAARDAEEVSSQPSVPSAKHSSWLTHGWRAALERSLHCTHKHY